LVADVERFDYIASEAGLSGPRRLRSAVASFGGRFMRELAAVRGAWLRTGLRTTPPTGTRTGRRHASGASASLIAVVLRDHNRCCGSFPQDRIVRFKRPVTNDLKHRPLGSGERLAIA
jgi:hypothetical protein